MQVVRTIRDVFERVFGSQPETDWAAGPDSPTEVDIVVDCMVVAMMDALRSAMTTIPKRRKWQFALDLADEARFDAAAQFISASVSEGLIGGLRELTGTPRLSGLGWLPLAFGTILGIAGLGVASQAIAAGGTDRFVVGLLGLAAGAAVAFRSAGQLR